MSGVIGSFLDKYEVLEKVGEGGMATVYRGRHATLNRDVAIKVLHPHLSSSTRNRKRFAREARAIEHLRHPNILEIFDYSGTDAGECYIVTEFVLGDTLSALLWRRGRLPPEVAASMALDLSRALSYAHREGILHRDLKPDNVMIRSDGTVKLMDFGIARFLDESQVTMTGALVGSPAYMSPEQAKEGKLDVRSDLFSLGTLLFQTTTGQLPFSGSNPSVILKNIVEGNRPAVVELVPAISPALADVIERLMASQREDRFDSSEAVVHALEGVLSESGIDRSLPEWSLSAYLQAPEAWEQRLEAHLRTFLLARGKSLLDAGDHLAALRLFNRLLSMDAENGEVLALVGRLHGAVRPARRVGLLLGVASTAVLVCALLAAWLAAPRHPAKAIESVRPEVPEVVAAVPA
ncbi:MAG: serine/threonine protein kinase, partial [Deltaproteobacteria bacterium]|nr:serine/threonine protein kinase [Deltaproteobacteria bacterium]